MATFAKKKVIHHPLQFIFKNKQTQKNKNNLSIHIGLAQFSVSFGNVLFLHLDFVKHLKHLIIF
jgi:hypothetical protein